MISEGENGFTFPPQDDGAGYAARIAELWTDPTRYQALRASSRAAFEARLNWTVWSGTVLVAMARLASARGAGERPDASPAPPRRGPRCVPHRLPRSVPAERRAPPGADRKGALLPLLRRDPLNLHLHPEDLAGVSLCEALYATPIISHALLRHYQVVYDWQTYESYFKFAFVRNPWDRLLSAYRFLLSGGWHDRDRRWAHRHLARHTSFEAFVLQGLSPGGRRRPGLPAASRLPRRPLHPPRRRRLRWSLRVATGGLPHAADRLGVPG